MRSGTWVVRPTSHACREPISSVTPRTHFLRRSEVPFSVRTVAKTIVFDTDSRRCCAQATATRDFSTGWPLIGPIRPLNRSSLEPSRRGRPITPPPEGLLQQCVLGHGSGHLAARFIQSPRLRRVDASTGARPAGRSTDDGKGRQAAGAGTYAQRGWADRHHHHLSHLRQLPRHARPAAEGVVMNGAGGTGRWLTRPPIPSPS
jgi:hypothetical protein